MNQASTSPRGIQAIAPERRLGGSMHTALVRRRKAAERRFRAYGAGALILSLGFLVLLFTNIIGTGASAFRQAYVRLDVDFAAAELSPDGRRDPETLAAANYPGLVKAAVRAMFPEVTSRGEQRDLQELVSSGAAFPFSNPSSPSSAYFGLMRSESSPMRFRLGITRLNIVLRKRDIISLSMTSRSHCCRVITCA